MARNPAYTDIRVSLSINVSSTYNYHGTVYWTRRGKREKHHLFADGGAVMRNGNGDMQGVLKLPRYVMREIARQMAANLAAGRVTFYEYDRDGNKRYDDLRYHESSMVDSLIVLWRKVEAEYG